MAMNTILTLVVVSVLLSGIFAAGFSSSDAYAKEGNNGSNGCENSQGKGNGNGNAQACKKNTKASTSEPCTEPLEYFLDGDGDGFGADAGSQTACPGELPSQWVLLNGDCDDTNPTINPGAGNC